MPRPKAHSRPDPSPPPARSAPQPPPKPPDAPAPPARASATKKPASSQRGKRSRKPPASNPPARKSGTPLTAATAGASSRVKTKPPPAPVSAAPKGQRLALEEDAFEQELDASIDAIARTSPPAESTPPMLSVEGAHDSFDELACVHLRPVRELMLELRFGSAPIEWLGLGIAALRTVRRFAEEIAHDGLIGPLDALIDAFERTQQKGTLDEADTNELAATFRALSAKLPALGSLDDELGRREPIIVRSLLLQVPGVYSPTLEKLAGAGLMSLVRLLRADADELALATGIDPSLAKQIAAKLAQYRREHATTTSSADTHDELTRLRALCDELRRLHRDHERAAEGWTHEAIRQKRAARAARAAVMLQIQVVLGRLGEVERAARLYRCSFERKLDELDAYVAAMASVAGARGKEAT